VERCNVGDSGSNGSSEADYFLKLAIIAAKAIAEIRSCGGRSQYFKAVEHCISHVASGGTLDNFRPLVRTASYAGIDRRETEIRVH
jgi:hypothetical protein